MITRSHREALKRDGFIALHHVVTNGQLKEVQALLDPLFDRFPELDCTHALHLGSAESGGVESEEINRAVALEPRLRHTQLFRVCHGIAGQLLGRPVFYRFDHAIYKEASRSAPTPWHQDQAFLGLPVPLNAVHMWIPLQDATVTNGCMWFIPGSHGHGLRGHRRAGGTGHSLEVPDLDASTAVCAPVDAGGLTIHRPMTMHMTRANDSTGIRRAWILHFSRWGRLGHLRLRNVPGLIARIMSK